MTSENQKLKSDRLVKTYPNNVDAQKIYDKLYDQSVDISQDIRDKTTSVCIDTLKSLLTDNQGFEIDRFTVKLCINMLLSLKQ